MTTVTAVKNDANGTSEKKFGQDQFLANAVVYRQHKRVVDACSGYDNVEDAMAGLKLAWAALERQVEEGGSYTPDRELGFGSDNAAVIADTLLGNRQTTGATRKAFKDLGKV
jgi:hypothetical protein